MGNAGGHATRLPIDVRPRPGRLVDVSLALGNLIHDVAAAESTWTAGSAQAPA
jgi:hypothetical protein